MTAPLEVHSVGGRLRWIVVYLSIVLFGVVVLTTSLLLGRGIDPAPQLPELGAVVGPAGACLGERVTALQSGEFVDLHRPGANGAATIDEQLGDRIGRGRLDKDSGRATLRGTCSEGARWAGRRYVAEVTAVAPGDRPNRANATVEGTLVAAGEDPVRLTIVPADPGADAAGGRVDARLSGSDVVARVFLAVAIIILASRALGLLLARLRQPRVIGEMVAGIMLGPSLLGAFFPSVTGYLFPAEVISVLRVMSQFGLIFFMFLIGLELEVRLVRRSGHLAVLVSHVSIVLPFGLGSLLALLLYPLLGGGSFTGFALFMGTAMAITAFPVLARILTDTGINRTRLGAVAITCAAVDDITAWCILAVVVGIAKAAGPLDAVRTTVLAVAFLAGMLFVVRPMLRRLAALYKTRGSVSPSIMAGLISGLFLAAWATEMIGIHAIFGAFLFGVVLPRSGGLRGAVTERIEDLTLLFLLPIFFAVVGLSTRFGLMDQPIHWAIAGVVIAVAIVGKWGGSTFAARSLGVSWRDASALGVLMNTRGLTEIVILTVGRSLGVISPALFTIMVLMALCTTLMATPLLARIYPSRIVDQEAAKGSAGTDRRSRRSSTDYRVVVGVSDPSAAAPLVELASSLHDRNGGKPQIVLAHVTTPPGRDEARAHRTAWDDAAERARSRLAPLADDLLGAGYDTRVRTGMSADVGNELARLAAAEDPNLVVLGWHRRILDGNGTEARDEPGDVLTTVLQRLACDVALLTDGRWQPAAAGREHANELPIAVESQNGSHQGAAVELAARLAQGRGRPLRLLPSDDDQAPWDPARDASFVVVEVGDDETELRTLAEAADAFVGDAAPPVVVVRPGCRRLNLAATATAEPSRRSEQEAAVTR